MAGAGGIGEAKSQTHLGAPSWVSGELSCCCGLEVAVDLPYSAHMGDETAEQPDLFWDTKLSDTELRKKLAAGSAQERLWVIRRLLEYGEWEEIWKFLTLDDVEWALPRLRFRSPELQSFWQAAVTLWRERAP